MKKFLLIMLSFLISSLTFFGGNNMKFYTPAFLNGSNIPVKFTCKGEDISPQLIWESPPEGTKSFAIIVDDPDAPMGTWVHWVIYNIPEKIRSLQEKIPPISELENGALQGINDFRNFGYGGPCPPPGKPHRYFFKLYALDTVLQLKAGATKKELLSKMKGHILEKAEFFGIFKR